MPNEFNIKNGFITSGNSNVYANLTVSSGTLTVGGTVSTDAAIFGTELITTGITASGTNWSGTSLATGYVHTPGSASALTSNLSATTSTSYIITYTVSGNTAGRYESITFGGVTYMIYANNTTNTITLRSVSNGALSILAQSATDGTIAITSVKVINDSTALVTYKNSSNTNITQERANSNQLYYGLNTGAKFNSLTIYNTAFGQGALSLNTSGQYNTGMGSSTLQQVTNASYLTAIGYNVFQNVNTPGNLYHVGLGGNIGAGITTSSGYGNMLIGWSVGNGITSASHNIGMGYLTLNSTTTGGRNIAIGTNSLNNNTTGGNNVAVGYASGNVSGTGASVSDSSSSVFLGYDTRPLTSGQTNQIVIGSTAIGIGSNSVVLGNDSVTKTALKGNVLIGLTTDSGQKLQVSGSTLIQGGLTATTFSGSSSTISGTKGTVNISGGSTTTFIEVTGSNTIGGTGYTDFIRVTNTAAGVPTPTKTFRVNNTGGFEIVNSAYNAVPLILTDSGNLVLGGSVTPNAWTAGQIIRDIILSNTEVTVSTTTIATSNSDTDFVTYSYTPLSSTSYLVIHYHLAEYSFAGGTGNDSYFSRIKVDTGEITYSKQSTVNGNRSGVLFPLTGRYTNSNTTAKSIVVACRRDSADDSITIANSAVSMWLRITEVAR
jgi:hypothetical protein